MSKSMTMITVMAEATATAVGATATLVMVGVTAGTLVGTTPTDQPQAAKLKPKRLEQLGFLLNER
jgi:hypothetical protein